MFKANGSTACDTFCGTLVLILGWSLVSSSLTEAQTTGNNAVYNGGGVVGSSAFIDAQAFANGVQGNDICTVLYNIISPSSYPPNGAVIDARGFNVNNAPSSSGNLTCSGTPWQSSNGNSTNNPATILLPYTQIEITKTWVLPNGSRITANAPGRDFPSLGFLQAASGFTGPMIQMGNSSCPSGICTGISVEHVTLDANNQAIDAIDNFNAQEQSFVNDVFLNNIGGVGLNVGAANSGPYSNIRFTAPYPSPSCSKWADSTTVIRPAVLASQSRTSLLTPRARQSTGLTILHPRN